MPAGWLTVVVHASVCAVRSSAPRWAAQRHWTGRYRCGEGPGGSQSAYAAALLALVASAAQSHPVPALPNVGAYSTLTQHLLNPAGGGEAPGRELVAFACGPAEAASHVETTLTQLVQELVIQAQVGGP